MVIFNHTVDTAILAGIGYIYSQQAKVSSSLTLIIIAISRVVEASFHIFADTTIANQGRQDNEDFEFGLHLGGGLYADAIAILALRYFKIIDSTGIAILSSFAFLRAVDLYHQYVIQESST